MFFNVRNYQQAPDRIATALRSFVPMRRMLLFILLVFGLTANGQDLKLQRTVKGHFDYMTTDQLGRLYLARGHELFLYYPDGEMKYRFSDLSRGEITHLDTRNPMKLLLFYPGYSQIVFLDNTLSRSHPSVDLNTLNLELAQLACTSFDNGFWVYDPVSFRLLRFDQGLKITNEVSNINQLVGLDINPIQMVEAENWVYMNDPKFGVFVFDSFGTYSRLIPITGAKRVQVRSNGIFFEYDDHLLKYDDLSFEQTEIQLPIKDCVSLRIEKNQLFLMMKEEVLIYTLDK